MKNIYLIFLLIAHVACGQATKWQKVDIDNKGIYEIENEGEIINTLFDIPETEGVIKSNLIVNNNSLNKIQFVKATLKEDTLKVLIHQTDPSYHHEYVITVYEDTYYIEYVFRTSGEQERLKWKTSDSTLKLNTTNFEKGQEIRGYTEYTGKCVEGCKNSKEIITVKGNFSAIIESN